MNYKRDIFAMHQQSESVSVAECSGIAFSGFSAKNENNDKWLGTFFGMCIGNTTLRKP